MRSLLVIAKVTIYVLTEVCHRGWGRYKQRGRYIQGCYIQWALHAGEKGRRRMDAPYVLNFARCQRVLTCHESKPKIYLSNSTQGPYFGAHCRNQNKSNLT